MKTMQLKSNSSNEHILEEFVSRYQASGCKSAVDFLAVLMDGSKIAAPAEQHVVIAHLGQTIASQQQTIQSQQQVIADLSRPKSETYLEVLADLQQTFQTMADQQQTFQLVTPKVEPELPITDLEVSPEVVQVDQAGEGGVVEDAKAEVASPVNGLGSKILARKLNVPREALTQVSTFTTDEGSVWVRGKDQKWHPES